MVTGDNVQTARSIARKCGILPKDATAGSRAGDGVVLDGKDFRERVCGADGELDQEKFDKVWQRLRVLARSTPLDKHVLVSGIQVVKQCL
jgi:magnesium-transporting ATPase (P-type)